MNDLADMIDSDWRERIEQLLAEIEHKTGVQIAVLTVPSLKGESIEGFSMRVAEAWKLGEQGKDNGVLLLVASEDREMRIEVGYGLEGEIPDVRAARIIRDQLTPAFRNSDYGAGIFRAASALASAVGLEETEVAEVKEEPLIPEEVMKGFVAPLFGFLVLVVGLLIFIFEILSYSPRFRTFMNARGIYCEDPKISRILRSGGGGGGFRGGGGSFGGGGASGRW